MSSRNFQLAVKFTLGATIEGGTSNLPNDHGGLTVNGVTQATWDAYCRAQGIAQCPVTDSTAAQRLHLYEVMFWNAAHCGALPTALAIAHFDWAVNHGVTGAIKTLQCCVGTTVDGVWGSITVGAVQRADKALLFEAYLKTREAWYAREVVIDPTQVEFIDGWDNRVEQLRTYLKGVQP